MERTIFHERNHRLPSSKSKVSSEKLQIVNWTKAEANFAKVEFLDLDQKTIEELEKNIACFSLASVIKLRFDALTGDFFTHTPNDLEGKMISCRVLILHMVSD